MTQNINPLDLIRGSGTGALSTFIGGQNQALSQQGAQLANQQAQFNLDQAQVLAEAQNQQLAQQQNISNTVNRLQTLQQDIGFGASPQQLRNRIQGFITESQERGGNPIDSVQALQALETGGVEGLSGLLNEAQGVFESQGFIAPSGGQFAGIQSSVTIPGKGSQVTTKDGRAVFIPLSEADQEVLAQFDAQNREIALQELAEQERVRLESADEKERNKQRNDIRTGYRVQATEATNALKNIEQARNVLQGLQTGKAAEVKATISKFLPGVVEATDEQVAEAVLNQLVFVPLSEFTGAISEGERDFAKSTVANLNYTPEANERLLGLMEQKLQQKINQQKEFAQFRSEGGDALDFVPSSTPIDLTQQLGLQQAPAQPVQPQSAAPQAGPQVGQVVQSAQGLPEGTQGEINGIPHVVRNGQFVPIQLGAPGGR